MSSKLYKCVRKLLQIVAEGDQSSKGILMKLLPKVPDIHKSWACYMALLRAAYEGWDDILKCFLDLGVNPNESEPENDMKNYFVWCGGLDHHALYLAARQGNANAVQMLLDAKAEMKVMNSKYNVGPLGPLEVAAEGGHVNVVKILLTHGAGRNVGQLNAALRAASNPQTVKTLLEAGADLEDRDFVGASAVHEAAFSGRPECLAVYLKSEDVLASKTNEGLTPLHAAAISGNRNCVAMLIEAGAQVNATDNLEATSLHYASCRKSGISIVPVLLNAGACVNAKDRSGRTPLHCAVASKFEDIVKILIGAGADPEAEDMKGRKPRKVPSYNGSISKESFSDAAWALLTPAGEDLDTEEITPTENKNKPVANVNNSSKIHSFFEMRRIAIWEMRKLYCKTYLHRNGNQRPYVECNLPLLKELVKKVPEVLCTLSCLKALQTACEKEKNDMLKIFLEAGASANASSLDDWQADDCPNVCECNERFFLYKGQPLIFIAAENGYFEVVNLLIKHGASLDRIKMRDHEHPWSPLEAASQYARYESVKAILHAGALLDIVQVNSALWHVCNPEIAKPEMEESHFKVVNLLLNVGADPNYQSETARNEHCLHGAAHCAWPAVFSLLLRRGADSSILSSNGSTALMNALHALNNSPIVEMLVSSGVDITVRGTNGETALHLAAGRYGDVEYVKAVLKAGAKVNARDNSGATPLLEAAKHRNGSRVPIFSALIAAGANVNARDKQKRNVLHWAAKVQITLEPIEFLIDAGAHVHVIDKKGNAPFLRMLEIDHNEYMNKFRAKVLKMLIMKGCFQRDQTQTQKKKNERK